MAYKARKAAAVAVLSLLLAAAAPPALPARAGDSPLVRIGLIYQDDTAKAVAIQSEAEIRVQMSGLGDSGIALQGIRFLRQDGYGHLISTESTADAASLKAWSLRKSGLIAYARRETFHGKEEWQVFTGPYSATETAAQAVAAAGVTGTPSGPWRVPLTQKGLTLDEATGLAAKVRELEVAAYPALTAEGWHVLVGNAASPEALGVVKRALYRAGIPYSPSPVRAPDLVQWVAPDGRITALLNAPFILTSSAPIKLNERAYRGGIEVDSAFPLLVSNRVSVEDYLKGVLPRQMSPNWHSEALKAQAVAARTYTLYHLGTYAAYGFDCAWTQPCLPYGGVAAESEATSRAVDETRGQVVTFGGQLTDALFHAHSGGHTAAASELFEAPAPYLQPKPDTAYLNAKWDRWEITRTREWLEARLNSHGYGVGKVHSVELGPPTESGRLSTINVLGATGVREFKGEAIRWLFDSPSTKARVALSLAAPGTLPVNQPGQPTVQPPAPELQNLKITGSGWGHGVG